MIRKTPLKAKKYWNPKRKPMRKVSKKKAKQNREYSKVRKEYLVDKMCIVCEKVHGITQKADVVQHVRGRGKHTTDESTFSPLCQNHWRWPEDNPEAAEAMGIKKSRDAKAIANGN